MLNIFVGIKDRYEQVTARGTFCNKQGKNQ